MTTTVFNAWAVLRHLIRPPKEHSPPDLSGAADEPSQPIEAMLAFDTQAVKSAMRRIGLSLSRFARCCIQAGPDGIFLSVRDDWVDEGILLFGEPRQWGRPFLRRSACRWMYCSRKTATVPTQSALMASNRATWAFWSLSPPR
jgi:hypothetical protein